MIASPPNGVIESLHRYVDERILPSDFIYAVLTNNLREAFRLADEANLAALHEIVIYCWNNIPAECWGNPAKVAAWLTPPANEDIEKGAA